MRRIGRFVEKDEIVVTQSPLEFLRNSVGYRPGATTGKVKCSNINRKSRVME